MKTLAAILTLSLVTPALSAQSSDTIIVTSGSGLVDGRYLVPHRALYATTVSRGDSVVSRSAYELRKRLVGTGAAAAFRLEGTATPDSPDPDARFFTILRHRTLETVHREDRDGSGRSLMADIGPREVTGYVTSPRDTGTGPFRVELDVPAFHASFVDAVLNGLDLRPGLVVRIAVVNLTQRRRDWRVFRVARRDSILVNGHFAGAWVVDEQPGGDVLERKFWLIREAPFFPLDESRLRNGTVRRIQQTLLPDLAERSPPAGASRP